MLFRSGKDDLLVRFLGTGAADWDGVDERGELRRLSSVLLDVYKRQGLRSDSARGGIFSEAFQGFGRVYGCVFADTVAQHWSQNPETWCSERDDGSDVYKRQGSDLPRQPPCPSHRAVAASPRRKSGM